MRSTWPLMRQGHLAIALACRGGFQFGDALFQVCAAVATQVGCLGGRHRHATHEQTSRGHERQPAGRLQQSPDHSNFSVGLTLHLSERIYRLHSVAGGYGVRCRQRVPAVPCSEGLTHSLTMRKQAKRKTAQLCTSHVAKKPRNESSWLQILRNSRVHKFASTIRCGQGLYFGRAPACTSKQLKWQDKTRASIVSAKPTSALNGEADGRRRLA